MATKNRMAVIRNGKADPAYAPIPGQEPMSKVEKQGWTIVDRPGRYMRIHKSSLHIDHEYQRSKINNARVLELAHEWSWAACLVLGVVERADGTYWVYEGQHRKLAADKRADVNELPCLVFRGFEQPDEAAAFLRVNTNRGPVKTVDKFNALVVTQDPTALAVKAMIEADGYKVGNASGDFQVKCVGALMRAARSNPAMARSVWSACVEIFSGKPVHEGVYSGLFALEHFLARRQAGSAIDAKNLSLLVKAGPKAILQSIATTKAFRGRGGDKVQAEGIVQVLNKGRRGPNHLPSPYGED